MCVQKSFQLRFFQVGHQHKCVDSSQNLTQWAKDKSCRLGAVQVLSDTLRGEGVVCKNMILYYTGGGGGGWREAKLYYIILEWPL